MDTPKGFPKLVYKYRTWSKPNHRKILTHNELYLASPRDFNDPFDCRIPPNFVSLDSPSKVAAFVTKSTIMHFEKLTEEGRHIPSAMKSLEDEISEDIWKFQRKYENGWFQSKEDYLGVISLSKRWNSILMWSHYAENHKGFCIGFYEEKLRNSELFGRGGIVAYNRKDKMPFIDPMEDDPIKHSFIETHTKAFDWKYEKEYRVEKTFYEGIPSENERIVKLPDDFIAEVILGLKVSTKHKERIIKICQKKGINVFQAEQVPFHFKLKRTRILKKK